MLDHPYDNLPASSKWQRGNLHTHTTRSDGKEKPQAVIDAYSDLGYDFLMISDHDTRTAGAEIRRWDARGLVLIPGNEISANGPHMLHVGGRKRISPHQDRQRVIDEAVASGGFVVCNHPDWQRRFDHFPFELLNELQGYTGLEIYNGTIGRLQGSPYALNKWDRLLSEGRRVWGFATDDSHLTGEDRGLGWVVVCTENRTAEGLVEAMQTGRFYASTGVSIQEIRVSGNRIHVSTRKACRLVALMDFGRRVAVTDGRSLTVEFPEQASYLRVECWGDGEQFAWTQPFFRARTTPSRES